MHLKNVLPEEILLEIFSEIEKCEIKKLLEISSVWRNLLIKNVKVMRKLPLILMNDTWREKLEFVENYGRFIREVDFVGAEIESFDEIYKLLELTPNVEKLSLIKVKFAQKETTLETAEQDDQQNEQENQESDEIIEETFIEKLSLKKLKEIVIEDEENIGLLKFIASHFDVTLSTLRCDLIVDAQLPILEKFLKESRHLKTFELTTDLDAIFNPTDEVIGEFQFKLERFLVKATMMKYNEQFVKFLVSQKAQMREIGFTADHVDFRFHQMMFTHFPLLRKIIINIDSLSTTDCLLKLRRIPMNKTLESLNILGRNLHLNIFEAILRLFPRISHLSIQNLTQFYSDKIRLLPLTQLHVVCVNCEYLRAEKLEQSTKVYLTNVLSQPKETYERNLQNFCDLSSQFSDKTKDIIEAF
jgi:hypothetical protein